MQAPERREAELSRQLGLIPIQSGKDYDDAAKDSFITRFGVSFALRKERYGGKP